MSIMKQTYIRFQSFTVSNVLSHYNIILQKMKKNPII